MTVEPSTTPPTRDGPVPGWYPSADMAGTVRYWDGTAWTDHVAPTPTTTVVTRAPSHRAPSPWDADGEGWTLTRLMNWPSREFSVARIAILLVLAVIALAVVGAVVDDQKDDQTCITNGTYTYCE